MWSIDEDIVQRVKVAGIAYYLQVYKSYDRNIIIIVYTTVVVMRYVVYSKIMKIMMCFMNPVLYWNMFSMVTFYTILSNRVET